MKVWGRRLLWLAIGLTLGVAGMLIWHRATESKPAFAFNDRTQDYIMCTGQILLGPNFTADGIWILDYRAGKLLGSYVDHNNGVIRPWAEVDLVQEFNIPPKQDVHFMMTTGTIFNGHTALYLTEINTGKFAVYGMAPRGDGTIVVRRFNSTQFRRPSEPNPEKK
ncbi:MAG TPA: hypothetical protein VFE62_05755 [Gemmataceae bacterium]|nr:hypothetical protein [Gemmataceae bacterium]